MSTEQSVTTVSREAGADLTGKQFHLVKLNSSGQVVVCSAAGEMPFGVLQSEADAAGKAVSVAIAGKSKVKLGGTVAALDPLKTDANAKAAVAVKGRTDTSDAGAAADPLLGSYVIGIATVAGANNEIGEILITHSGSVPTTTS
jgi:hypothetical protein